MEDPLVSTKIVDAVLRCLSDGSSVNEQGPGLASNQVTAQPSSRIAPMQPATPPPLVSLTPPPMVSQIPPPMVSPTPPPMVSRTPPPIVSRAPPPLASRTQASAPPPYIAQPPGVSLAIHREPSTLQPFGEWEDIER